MIDVAIAGAAGRMGRMLATAISAADDMRISAALEHPESPHLNADVGELAGIGSAGVSIGNDVAAVADAFDVLVDFSSPAGTLAKLNICEAQGKGMVIGTTGFDADGLKALDKAAEQIPLLIAPNMSVGVNVAFKLIEYAAKALGDEVDVEVFEAHHRHKVDAPSGTAVYMGEILATTLNRDLDTDAVYGRQGITGARDRKTIGFHSLRGGDIVGDHTVTFAGTGERIEITHRAGSRENFAAGAVRAVRFIYEKCAGKDVGHYGMDDVLGL